MENPSVIQWRLRVMYITYSFAYSRSQVSAHVRTCSLLHISPAYNPEFLLLREIIFTQKVGSISTVRTLFWKQDKANIPHMMVDASGAAFIHIRYTQYPSSHIIRNTYL